jgi:hypothetical protein
VSASSRVRAATLPSRRFRARPARPPGAADLVPVASLSEDGALLRSDGALVRYLEVLPRNPLVMDEAEAEQMGHGFAALLARLPAGQALQVHVQATPVALEQLVAEYRAGVDAAVTALDGRVPERGAALRELAEVHVESLQVHAGDHAAVRVRSLLVVPVDDQTGGGWRRLRAGSRAARRPSLARTSLALVDALRSELEALDMGVRLLDGPDVADVLFGRFAPAISATQLALAPCRRPAILSAGPGAADQEASEGGRTTPARGDRRRRHRRLRPSLAHGRRWARADGPSVGCARRDVLQLAVARDAPERVGNAITAARSVPFRG